MKNRLTILLLAALLVCVAFPATAQAKEIEFEVAPGVIWRLIIPDEIFNMFAKPAATAAPTATAKPTATPCPTSSYPTSPERTPSGCPVASTPAPSASPAPTSAPDTGSGSRQAEQNSSEAQMLSWVNAERAKSGLSPYKLDSSLTYWARAKSQDMVDKNYFAHNSPTYGSSYNMLKNGGVSFVASAENIARFGSLEKAHAGLMASPGHNANIMSKSMQRAGIGVVRTNNAFYVTQLFVR
ncbi:MAG: CAP domain-containing protein [Christensenellales bacterium]|jgi:uncharacterized protein YkwD